MITANRNWIGFFFMFFTTILLVANLANLSRELDKERERNRRYINYLEERLSVYDQTYPEPLRARMIRDRADLEGILEPGRTTGYE